MTALQLTIVAILFQHYQPLLTPVLQHLPDGVVGHVGSLYRYRVLHSLLEGKLDIQSFKDGVVLASLLSFTVHTTRIVTTLESVLNAVAEEVEGVLQQRVGYYVVGLQHGGCLRLQQHFLPQAWLLFQLRLRSTQSVLLNQRLTYLAEHQATRHSLRRHTDTEALTGTRAVVVLHRFQTDALHPFATLCLQFRQHHLAIH